MSLFNTLTRTPASTETETLPTRRPYFEASETESSYVLTVHLPGVSRDGLEITDENGQLRIFGRRTFQLPKDAVLLHRESADAGFELVLDHDNTVDAEKVEAELKDGLLRLKLAKAESAKPRRIAIS
jgi:HSP20 family molecular chaperone IbpA